VIQMGDNDHNLDTNMTPASRNAINVLSTLVYSSLVARLKRTRERREFNHSRDVYLIPLLH